MLAVGAQDRFEPTSAMQLFRFSKVLLFDTQRKNTSTQNFQSSPLKTNDSRRGLLDQLCCLLCLAHFATWQTDGSLKTEACILQSLLAQLLRQSGLEENSGETANRGWEEWAFEESTRRAKLFAFCFLGMTSIAHDTPPSILCDEINLKLPCSCPEWTAPDAFTWDLLRKNTPNEQGMFRDTLHAMLAPQYEPTCVNSPVANYVLIHALLQNIVWTRRSIPINLSLASSNEYNSVFKCVFYPGQTSYLHFIWSSL